MGLSIVVIHWIQTHWPAWWIVWTGISLLFIPYVLFRNRPTSLSEPNDWSQSPSSFFALAGGMFLLWVFSGSVWTSWTDRLGVSNLWRSVGGALFIPFLPTLLGFWALRRKSVRRGCGLQFKGVGTGFKWAIAGIFIAMPWVWWSLQATLKLWEWLGYQHPQKHSLLLDLDRSDGIGIRLAVITAAVVVAPVFEEMLFRGFLQTGIRQCTRFPWIAIGTSSLFFALIHSPWQAPPIFVLSLFLGLIYEKTRSLWTPIVMHAAFNASVILFNSLSR